MKDKALPLGLSVLAVLSAITVAMTQPVITRVDREVSTSSMLLAKLMSSLFLSVLSEQEIADAMKDVISSVDFPLMLTDQNKNPRAWKMVGVDPDRFSPEQLANPELLAKDPDYQKLIRARDAMARQNKPFAISGGGNSVVGYVYYGKPRVLELLRILQFALPLFGLITFLGLLGAARSVYKNQMASFWASFAKGLAHQMGTPVSSSFGWLELLKRHKGVDPKIVQGLQADLERMRSILQRFSKIGGPPELQPTVLSKIIESSVLQAENRFLRDMDVQVITQGQCVVNGDPELLSWVFEIFLKNAYEARAKQNARIIIKIHGSDGKCRVDIEDNGRGIPKDKHKLLFKRSFSTKERGWGVGLMLVKRIVEDIHNGKVQLAESLPGQRTVFRLHLPLAKREEKMT